jgi:hypothetical protein
MIAPASNWLQRNLYGGGYHEVGNYGAIDAFPHPGYTPAAGAQEDDALAQKMAELMQNQFGLKPKMQGPSYTRPFPEWYYNVLLPPRVDGIHKIFRSGRHEHGGAHCSLPDAARRVLS